MMMNADKITKNKPAPITCSRNCYGRDCNGKCHVLKFPFKAKPCPYEQTRAARYAELNRIYGFVERDEWDEEN